MTRADDTRLRILTRMDGILPEQVREVQIASIHYVALYRRELWWDLKETGR